MMDRRCSRSTMSSGQQIILEAVPCSRSVVAPLLLMRIIADMPVFEESCRQTVRDRCNTAVVGLFVSENKTHTLCSICWRSTKYNPGRGETG